MKTIEPDEVQATPRRPSKPPSRAYYLSLRRWLSTTPSALALVSLAVLALLVVQLAHRPWFGHSVFPFRLGDFVVIWLYLALLGRILVSDWRVGRRPALSRLHLALVLLLALLTTGSLLGWLDWLARTGQVSLFSLSLLAKALVLYSCGVLLFRLRGRLTTAAGVRTTPLSPPAMVVASFALVIILGWLLLSLPEATPPGKTLSPLDSLFTATSAVCVTGLIVKDTPADFSNFGHGVILLLIQTGGLGIMTLTALFGALLGRRFSVREHIVVRDMVIGPESKSAAVSLGSIILFALLTEAVAAGLLTASWFAGGLPLGRSLVLGVFHSVSAFCNAGFSLFSTSLEQYSGNVFLNLVMMGLIVVGGMGFPVVLDLARNLRRRLRGQRPRQTLHTRLVLITSGGLLAAGAVFFFAAESPGVLRERTPGEQVLASCFQSVTPRTAGFNTVDIAALREATLLVLILLMFVGASPGSTGGGIKTATFALLVLTTLATSRGARAPATGRRRLPEAARHRAFAVFALMFTAVLFFTLFLSLTQSAPLLTCLFEAVSALGTVGLTMGLTPRLTQVGRAAIIVAMLMGRVGPLTLALAIRPQRRAPLVSYPEEDVMVG